MMLAQLSFATNDMLVKIIYQNYQEIFVLNQIIFIRGIFACFVIVVFLFLKNQLDFKVIFSSKKLAIRGLLEALCCICFFIGIAKLPFAKVYVLLSLAPILLTIYGAIFFNPADLKYGYYFIFPLLAAILLTFRDIYTKNIKGNFHSLQIAFITCLIVTIFFGVLSIYKFYNFNSKEYLIMFLSSFFLSLGYIFSIATIKATLVSVTSTFRYSVILWGVLFGYFIFNEIPRMNTYIGAFMIVVSGLIIISRQKQLGKIK